MSEEKQIVISDISILNKFLERLNLFEKRTQNDSRELSESLKVKVKYLYWQLKEQSPFTQKKPKRLSLSKIQQILDKESSKQLADPLIMSIWLKNDYHDEDASQAYIMNKASKSKSIFEHRSIPQVQQIIPEPNFFNFDLEADRIIDTSTTESLVYDSPLFKLEKSIMQIHDEKDRENKFEGFSSFYHRLESLQEKGPIKRLLVEKRNLKSFDIVRKRSTAKMPGKSGTNLSKFRLTSTQSPIRKSLQLPQYKDRFICKAGGRIRRNSVGPPPVNNIKSTWK